MNETTEQVYIVTFEERYGGFEEFSYLAVKGADKMSSLKIRYRTGSVNKSQIFVKL